MRTEYQKWTVRNFDPEALALLKEVHWETGIPLGELLTEAVITWYEDLPEAGEDA